MMYLFIHHTDAVPKEAHSSSSSMGLYTYTRNKAQNDSWFSCHVLLSWIREKMEELLQQWEMPTSFLSYSAWHSSQQHYGANAILVPVPATTLPCLQRTLY